jgi:NAD+ synthase (glutamine-hydrolysing)
MMTSSIRIGLAQINCTVGDLAGNCSRIEAYIGKARKAGVDIVCFPELAITGYPPEDLLLKPQFIMDNLRAIEQVAGCVKGLTAVVGFVDAGRRGIYNAAAVIHDGQIKGIHHKKYLPNYNVFDEKRYFLPGRKAPVFVLGPVVFGVNVCEDIWFMQGPARTQAHNGAKLICNINASPYHAGKILVRQEIAAKQAKTNRMVVAYTNLVGGQDELVFDGQSLVVDAAGTLLGRARAFTEDLLVVDLEIPAGKPVRKEDVVVLDRTWTPRKKAHVRTRTAKAMEPAKEAYSALSLGLHDYVHKNGFGKVVIGLSGGIDSALVAVLAVDALGKENVATVFMPSRYSSKESEIDARELAERCAIPMLVVPIEPMYRAYLETLKPSFEGKKEDITEENLQARIRGNILMALSNKFGWLVLTTGNKSEMSVGYATLYGDMAGGFAVIKDVPKTLVYELCTYRNSLGRVIPERILTKAPSAELKPDQKDTDTLPPYEILDPVLRAYVEEDRSRNHIVDAGFGENIVRRVMDMVDKSEYKRRQSPPGIKITAKAFGKDRRVPITNKYKG